MRQNIPNPDDPAHKLRTHQIRVLRMIGQCAGALSRPKIADFCHISPTLVSRALGLEDKEKREHFEQHDKYVGYPSLITLGMVERLELDIEGIREIAYRLSAKGRKALEETKDEVLPPLKGTEVEE